MITRTPSGHVAQGPVGPELILTRTLPHSADAVWRYLTDPEMLGTWYGTYEGDPATGVVTLTTQEAPDQPGEARIQHCEAPNALAVTIDSPAGVWVLTVQVTANGGSAELEFRQRLGAIGYSAAELGPGWEYYLDRLTLAMEDGDVDSLTWDDYVPLGEHYADNADN